MNDKLLYLPDQDDPDFENVCESIIDLGYEARIQDEDHGTLTENPYLQLTDEYGYWEEGYKNGEPRL